MEPPPSREDVAAFVDLTCINSLSSGSYSTWVAAEADAKHEWAIAMLRGVSVVEHTMKAWIDHMELVSNRRSGGLSVLCSIIPVALPIAKKYTVHAVHDCAVTGQRGRPCFEIVSLRTSQSNIYVHRGLLDSCQTLWAVQNYALVVRTKMMRFSARVHETQLDKICSAFDVSPERTCMLDYLEFIGRDVQRIFMSDNCFVGTA